LYKGFKNIHPEPILKPKEPKQEEDMIPSTKKIAIKSHRDRNSLSKHKRLEYEHCLSWAKKHNKNGEYFASQLGKNGRDVYG